MNRTTRRMLSAFAVALVASLATSGLVTQSSGAPGGHFVLTDDNSGSNTGTIMQLVNKSLQPVATLTTGGMGSPDLGYNGETSASIVPNGDGACLFIGDADSSDIAAFVWPSLMETGTYGGGDSYNAGISLAARGGYLFATYISSSTLVSYTINPDCSLTLDEALGTVQVPVGIAAAPNGKVVIVASGTQLMSYSVGEGGQLTPHGPYPSSGAVGVDISADSKLAAVAERNNQLYVYTMIGLYQINSDGTIGDQETFGGDGSFGDGVAATYVRFSPDQRFLYVVGSGMNYLTGWLTTLNLTTNPLNLTYSGCHASATPRTVGWSQPATAEPTGAGGFMYVASPASTIYVLKIRDKNGCMTEVPGSPFATGKGGLLFSIAVWPPRGF